jgi:hypothetical protein
MGSLFIGASEELSLPEGESSDAAPPGTTFIASILARIHSDQISNGIIGAAPVFPSVPPLFPATLIKLLLLLLLCSF